MSMPQVSFEQTVIGKGKSSRFVMVRPVRLRYLNWPIQKDGNLRVRCWMYLGDRRLACGGEAVEGRSLDFYLPVSSAGKTPYLSGLCSFRDSHRRARWFAKRHKRIRALLPPIVRLAFDRWYGP